MTLARNPNTLNPDLFRHWRKHEKRTNKKSLFSRENLHESFAYPEKLEDRNVKNRRGKWLSLRGKFQGFERFLSNLFESFDFSGEA